MARQETANVIINAVALEVGFSPVGDPVSDTDDLFVQLTGLLTVAGQELVELNEWQFLRKEYNFTTGVADSGIYDLPDNFSYMLDQTGWDRTSNFPLTGPLSGQDWSYLEGRGLVNQTIYASFRLADNKLYLFPQPPPDSIEINFEYMSRDWVMTSGESEADKDSVTVGSDLVLFEPILIKKFLKLKFLDAKGFDSSRAALDFENMFNSRTGKDTGASILSAGGNSRGFPYIDTYRNLGDTNYGA